MIHLTREDLEKIGISQGYDEQAALEFMSTLLSEMDVAFDPAVEAWMKGTVVSSVIKATELGANPIQLYYELLAMGMFLGAKMQSNKGPEEMTLKLLHYHTDTVH